MLGLVVATTLLTVPSAGEGGGGGFGRGFGGGGGFSLEPDLTGQTLTVRVVEAETGQPLPGTTVSGATGSAWDPTLTGEDGEVVVPVRQNPRGINVVVRHSGWTSLAVRWRRATDVPAKFELRLEPALPLAGAVVDEAGTPVADAEVLIFGPWHTPPGVPYLAPGQKTRTNLEGQWSIADLPPDAAGVWMVVRHPAFQYAEFDGPPRLPPAEALRDGTAQLVLRPGIPVSGRVVDVAGRPRAGLEVELSFTEGRLRQKSSATTGTDGVFRFNGGTEGKNWVRVQADGRWGRVVSFDVGEAAIDLGDVVAGVDVNEEQPPRRR